MENEKPIVINQFKNEWEFVHPPEIDNENIENELWSGIELLNCNVAKAETIFKKLIDKHPYHIDAYVHLSIAFKNQKKRFESFITAEKAYIIGKSCFPKKFNIKKHKLRWGDMDNRPFLRACCCVGSEYQDMKQFEKAIESYQEIIAYNEDDNQGVRYMILECLFALKDFDQAEKLIEKYDGDWGIEFVYGKLIIAILKDKLENIDSLLSNASERNKFVFDEIIRTEHIAPPPFTISGKNYSDIGVPVSSVQEAYEYWDENKKILKDKRIISFFEKYLAK